MVKKSSKKPKEKLTHNLVPEHVLLNDEEKAKVLHKFATGESSFPRIYSSDPALIGIETKPGDLILIKRKDHTGNYDYYRIVAKG
ncbi:MAG: DNA-directed RNA polymerase subunit RpoH/Rpb5 C-terminal domain-containing protein [Candidatus Micrarchaeia archaeon]